MSRADTQFTYISATDTSTLSASYRTVDRPPTTMPATPGTKMATRRSSSVASSRRGHVTQLRWSKRSYSVQELTQEFNRRFPVLARVTHSFCCSSLNALKLNIGQVLHVHGVCSVQKRVRATNAAGQTLSIPLDCPINVQRLTSAGHYGVMSLSAAVSESHDLPITLQCVNHQSRDPHFSALEGEQLSIIQLYNSTFLLANPIHNGWLDVSQTVFIPDDLSARLCVAEGLIGASDDEWLDYCGMFARAARPIKFSPITQYKWFYYTSLGESNAAVPASSAASPVTPVVPLSVASAASASGEVSGHSHLDVQPYIISHSDANYRRRSVDVPQHQRRHLSVVATSQDRLNVSDSCLRHSLTSRLHVPTTSSASSSVRVTPSSGAHQRRRRRSGVAETSFIESSVRPATERSVAVQVSLPAIQVNLPARAPVPQLPRMGRLAPVCHHHKSPSSDDVDHSETVQTTESGLGGSMPCLLQPGDDLVSSADLRMRDVLVPSALSTSSSSCPSTGRTSTPVKPRPCRSDAHIICVDEGYLTKESNTSTSSLDTSRHSPVYF